MKKRKRIFIKLIRNIETIKTVAIILLMVSCVYFGILVFQYQCMPNGKNLSFFIWNNFEYISEYDSDTIGTGRHEIIRNVFCPEYIVTDNINGREIFYCKNDEYDELCNVINNYIFSVYTSESKASSEKVVNEEEWIADLNSEFIYAKLPQEISTEIFSGTEYEGNMISKSMESYDEIIITSDSSGNSTLIYLGSSASSEKLRIILEKSPLSMLETVEKRTYGAEKKCFFAFELKNDEFADYSIVDKINELMEEGRIYINPMFMLPVSTINTSVISLSVPEKYIEAIHSIDNSEIVDDLLGAFEYTRDDVRQYRDKDGNIAFVDGSKTLEFSESGIVTYTNSNATDLEKCTLIEGISELYKNIYMVLSSIYEESKISGECIVISDINTYDDAETGKDIITEISFDYKIGGYNIVLESGESFITAKLRNGALENVSINLKEISVVDEYIPNEPAFAVINRYIDGGEGGETKLNVSGINLKYIYAPASSNCHTSWVVKTAD